MFDNFVVMGEYQSCDEYWSKRYKSDANLRVCIIVCENLILLFFFSMIESMPRSPPANSTMYLASLYRHFCTVFEKKNLSQQQRTVLGKM